MGEIEEVVSSKDDTIDSPSTEGEEVTKEVEFEDGTSYEVTYDGRVTETTSVYDKFFNELQNQGFDVERGVTDNRAYIGGDGVEIVGGWTPLEDIADEYDLEILHLWTTSEMDDAELPIFIAMEEQNDTEPKQPFDEYLRENVLTSGGYHIDESNGIADVAEYEDGEGYLIHNDYRNVEEDNNVLILDDPTDGGGHFNGEWLVLEDGR